MDESVSQDLVEEEQKLKLLTEYLSETLTYIPKPKKTSELAIKCREKKAKKTKRSNQDGRRYMT